MSKNRGFLPGPGRFYIENVQGQFPRIGASCLERGGGGGAGGGWWWWLVVVVMVMVVVLEEADGGGGEAGLRY